MIALAIGVGVAAAVAVRLVPRRRKPAEPSDPPIEFRRGRCGGNPDVTD